MYFFYFRFFLPLLSLLTLVHGELVPCVLLLFLNCEFIFSGDFVCVWIPSSLDWERFPLRWICACYPQVVWGDHQSRNIYVYFSAWGFACHTCIGFRSACGLVSTPKCGLKAVSPSLPGVGSDAQFFSLSAPSSLESHRSPHDCSFHTCVSVSSAVRPTIFWELSFIQHFQMILIFLLPDLEILFCWNLK